MKPQVVSGLKIENGLKPSDQVMDLGEKTEYPGPANFCSQKKAKKKSMKQTRSPNTLRLSIGNMKMLWKKNLQHIPSGKLT